MQKVPELCRFYGIVVRMYFGDHPPAHFHAVYGDDEAVIEIETLAVLNGHLPARARGLVLEWASLHQQELGEAWERAKRLEPPGSIDPLE